MKSQFRTNIESALNSAGMPSISNASCVFLDRHKCSDRIKFSFTTATNGQLKRIKTQVQKFYPNETVKVYNNTPVQSYRGYCGVAISVSHKDNVSL